MPANTDPIYTLTPQVKWIDAVATANTDQEMDAGTVYDTGFVGGSNGSRIFKICFRAKGSNVVSVARIWLNNGSTTATLANNSGFIEFTLGATTANAAAALPNYHFPLDIVIPSGYKLYVTLGTTVAAGYQVTVFGGDY